MMKLLNILIDEYVIAASSARKKQVEQGINFLKQEEPILLKRVRNTQKELEDFRLKNQTLDPVLEGETLKAKIDDVENKIIKLSSDNARFEFIKKNLDNGILFTQGISSTNIKSDSSYLPVIGSDQLLLEEILAVKEELAKAQSKYKGSSIIVQNLKGKLSELEPVLIKNQKSAVNAALTVNIGLIKAAEDSLIELKTLFGPIPRLVTEYSIIAQNLKNLETNFFELVRTKDKLELELSQEILPWKVIQDPSVGGTPIKPDIQRNVVYIILFSLVLTSIITYIIDRLDNVYHSADEVDKYINLPILGLVPFFQFEPKDIFELDTKDKINPNNNLLKDENYFIFQETFRNIFTSIKFSNIDKEIKTISLTSTIPEEGKSMIAIFLALNIAEISKKVLIIDTDLRRPSLHQKLNVDNVIGLSNCLVGSNSNWKDFVIEHEKIKNFSYMTAGKVPPNPVRLLESQKMKDLIENVKKSNEYDLIIFDCPPVLGLADSLIVSDLVDGVILNVSLNKVDRTLSLETIKKLNVLKTPKLGLVINTVQKPTKEDPTRNKYFTNYMPIETSNRYGFNSNDDKKLIDEANKRKSFNKKLNDIILRFKDWLND